MCSNESSDVGSSFIMLSSAVRNADVTLSEMSWIISRRIFEPDDALCRGGDLEFTVGGIAVGSQLIPDLIGEREWTAGAIGGGTVAVGSGSTAI